MTIQINTQSHNDSIVGLHEEPVNDEVDATQVPKPGFDDSCNTTTTANEKLCDDKIQRSDRNTMAPRLVFSSPAACHPAVLILITLPILLLIAAGVAKHRAGKQAGFIAVICAMFVLILVYSLVFPRRLDVYSDASIAIITLVKWRFGSVTEAHRFPGLISVRPRMKFVMSPANRVVVRRKDKCCDILVSPVDPDGFVEAIRRVVAANETAVNEQIAPLAPVGEKV